MIRTCVTLIALGLSSVVAPEPTVAHGAGAATQQATGVPAEFAGAWVCQTFRPGYNVTPYHADISQPLTNKMTTPGSVAVVKMTLKTDGTYQTTTASGHYTFNAGTKVLTWVDGPAQTALTKTQLGRRDNGAPKMSFIMNHGYYGCFMPAKR